MFRKNKYLWVLRKDKLVFTFCSNGFRFVFRFLYSLAKIACPVFCDTLHFQ